MEAEQWCLVRQEELDMIRRKDILGKFCQSLIDVVTYSYTCTTYDLVCICRLFNMQRDHFSLWQKIFEYVIHCAK